MSGWLNRNTNVLHAHDILVGSSYYQPGIWSACRRLKVADANSGLRSNVEYVPAPSAAARRCEACVHRLTEHRYMIDRWLRGET